MSRQVAISTAIWEWFSSLVVGGIPFLGHAIMEALLANGGDLSKENFVSDLLFMAVAMSGSTVVNTLLVLRKPECHAGPSLTLLITCNVVIFVLVGIVYGVAASGNGNELVWPFTISLWIGSMITSFSAHAGLAAASVGWSKLLP